MSSDIARDLKTQPLTLPVYGGGSYVAPGEAWDGTPNRSPLGPSEELLGLFPNTKLPAEVINDFVGRLGHALSTIVDAASVNWTVPAKAIGDMPAFEGMGNGLFAGPFIIPAQTLVEWQGEVLGAVNSSGLWISRDGRRWTNPGAIGFATQVECAVAGVQASFATIVAFALETGDYEFRYSTDLGNSWATAGNAPTPPSGDTIMGYYGAAEIFYWASNDGTLAYSDDIIGNTWAVIDVSGVWTTGSPVKFAANDEEILLALNADPWILRSSSDGLTFFAANTNLEIDPSPVVDLIWSPSRAKWYLRRADGSLWSASAGAFSWSAEEIPGSTGGELGEHHAMVSHGRCLTMAAGDGLWVSRDVGRWVHMTPIGDTGASFAYWEWLLPFNGAIWAGHRATKADGYGITFEHSFSGTLAPELMRIAPW